MKNRIPFFCFFFLIFTTTSLFSQVLDSSVVADSVKLSNIKFKNDTYNGLVYISPLKEIESVRLYNRSGRLLGSYYKKGAIHLNRGYRFYEVEVDAKDGKVYKSCARAYNEIERYSRKERPYK